jgi:hypothetical protein
MLSLAVDKTARIFSETVGAVMATTAALTSSRRFPTVHLSKIRRPTDTATLDPTDGPSVNLIADDETVKPLVPRIGIRPRAEVRGPPAKGGPDQPSLLNTASAVASSPAGTGFFACPRGAFTRGRSARLSGSAHLHTPRPTSGLRWPPPSSNNPPAPPANRALSASGPA